MTVQLRRVGDRFFLAVEAAQLEELSLDESTPLEVVVQDGELVVRRAAAVEETTAREVTESWLDRTVPAAAAQAAWHGRQDGATDDVETTLPAIDLWTDSDRRSAFFRGRRQR